MSGCTPTPASRYGLPVAAGALRCLAMAAGASPDDAEPFARWESAIAEFEKLDKEQPPSPGGVLFVGSSSIRKWDLAASFPDLDCVNRGFGGSEIADSRHFAPRFILPHRPRIIVLYAGDNDLAREKTPDRVHEDFIAFTESIHQTLPKTRILFLGIKPSLARWELIEQIRAANDLIASTCAEDERLQFIDIESKMLNDEGKPREELLADDGLHLSKQGYAAWTELLMPHLESFE